jgi:hypothetical protein
LALIFLYGIALDPPLRWIGTQPYAAQITFCLALIAPPAFLMGFPMPGAMGLLAKQGTVGPDGALKVTRSDIFDGKMIPFVPLTGGHQGA